MPTAPSSPLTVKTMTPDKHDEERAGEIARAGDYWKDYESILCRKELKSGGKCNCRLHAAQIDIALLIERISAALSAARREERTRAEKIALAYPDLWEEPDSAARDIRKLAAAEIASAIRSPVEGGGT